MWELLDKIGVVLGIIAFIPIVVASIKYVTKDAREKKIRRKAIEAYHGQKSAALVISFGNESLRTDVECFLKEDDSMKKHFPETDKVIHEIHTPGVMPEDSFAATDEYIQGFIKKFLIAKKALKETGVDNLHVFFKGPAMIMGMVGNELSNCFNVLGYHHPSKGNKKYICVGPFDRD